MHIHGLNYSPDKVNDGNYCENIYSNCTFNQIVELYRGDCPPDTNINETRLKITSDAPSDQVIKLQIDVNMGPDSYQIKEDSLAIEAKGTVDLGVVAYGGGRIDFAAIEIAIYCPLCPEDVQ